MFDNKEICLVIVFNHRYDENIEKLEKIYRERFNNIYYLVPFYDGSRQNVIPVYESSYTYQGYFAQAFEKIFDEKYSHYVFLGDDLILNQKINSENIVDELKLKNTSGYMKGLWPISNSNFLWPHLLAALNVFDNTKPIKYVNWDKELPEYSQALNLFKKHKIELNDFTWQKLIDSAVSKDIRKFSLPRIIFIFINSFIYLFKHYLNKTRTLPYPLARCYSDFIIIPSQSLKNFCHLCGIFAAMNLFVEVAIPTAMVFSCENIVTQKDIAWRGIEKWGSAKGEFLEGLKNSSLKDCLDSFAENELYIHPIKLSIFKE